VVRRLGGSGDAVKIAVIGGGLFGSTAAIYAARAGHDVTLFEAKADLMCGATAATFARLHRGYHYPRSPETGRESVVAEASFRAEYGEAVIDGGRQAYIVADGGHITPDGYRIFLESEGLEFFQDGARFDVVEPRINLAKLAASVRRKVTESGVTLRLAHRLNRGQCWNLRSTFDRIIVATYARLNDLNSKLGCDITEYKFQVVERPVVKLPDAFRGQSIVVIDGPFGCIDPLDQTGYHILGHVVKTIHAENVGYGADIPSHLAHLLDRGVITNCAPSRFREVADDLARYVPGVEKAEHIGSTFTVRAVLARQEATDARPTLVERMNGQIIRVFSGKLGTAVKAAEEALMMLPGRIVERKLDTEVVIPATLGKFAVSGAA
jgi:hypothetical protein